MHPVFGRVVSGMEVAEEGTLIIDIVGTFGVVLTLIVVDRIGLYMHKV